MKSQSFREMSSKTKYSQDWVKFYIWLVENSLSFLVQAQPL